MSDYSMKEDFKKAVHQLIFSKSAVGLQEDEAVFVPDMYRESLCNIEDGIDTVDIGQIYKLLLISKPSGISPYLGYIRDVNLVSKSLIKKLRTPALRISSKYYLEDCVGDSLHIMEKIVIGKRDEERFNYILKGEKGSGKTTTLNCWLIRNNNKLNDNNILWIKVDVSFLYEYAGMPRIRNSVDINDYTRAYLAFIFAHLTDNCKKEYKPYSSICNSMREDQITFDKITRGKIIKSDVYEYLNQEVSAREIVHFYNNIRDAYFSEDQNWLKNMSKAGAAIINRYISTMQAPYKLLVIIDGIDNVEFSNPEEYKTYSYLIKQLAEYLLEQKLGIAKLVAARYKTAEEIIANVLNNPRGEGKLRINVDRDGGNILELKQPRAPIISIAEKYEEILRNNIKKPMSDKQKKILKIYTEYAKRGINKIKIKNVYHNNIPNYLYYKYTTVDHAIYRLIQNVAVEEYDSKNKLVNITQRIYQMSPPIKVLDNINIYLAGKLAIKQPTHKRDRRYSVARNNKKGPVAPNVFYGEYRGEIWYGMTAIRIMQYIIYNGCAELNEIIQTLNKLFQYDTDIIKRKIYELAHYSVIDTSIYYDVDDEEIKIEYCSSAKTRYIMSNIKSEISTIYILGIHTYLPKNIAKNLIIHNNKIELDKKSKSNIGVSAIISGLEILKYIRSYSQMELRNAINRYDRIKDDIVIATKSLTEKIFTYEPNIDKIVQTIVEIYSNLDINSKDVVADYIMRNT